MEKPQIVEIVQDLFKDILDNEEIVLTPTTIADDIEE